MRHILLPLAASVILARPVMAQCPDGTPPPCAGRRPTTGPAPIDLNRIAVLPFRVSAGDSMLGEGIAELVASELTGESGLRAVHMGSVISAWRRAGGGPRSPLPQPGALRLARAMGAGLLVDGSVVGVGQRLTITATVVRSADGTVRRAAPVTGSLDSLDALCSRVVVGVMAAAGGEARPDERTRTTFSPAAMRAYLEGLALYRRGSLQPAQAAFERAIDLDSTFALAAFRRLQIAIWFQERGEIAERWGPLAWSFRGRLGRADRVVLEAFLGPRFPAVTPPAEWFAAAERATREAPESPDAWYQYGDLLFHSGGAIGDPNPIARALTVFTRAFALDSQELVLEHLVEGAMLTGDTALLRRLAPIYTRVSESITPTVWFAAAQLGDARTLAELRRRAGPWVGATVPFAGLFGASRAATDELIDILVIQRRELRGGFFTALMSQGRPRAARAFWQDRMTRVLGNDIALIEQAAWADFDSVAGKEALARIEARTPANAAEAGTIACARAQWQMARGLPVDADTAALRRARRSLCALMVDLVRASQRGEPETGALLAAADSAVRDAVISGLMNGYEGVMLSRLWEARGEPRRALDAVRLRAEELVMTGGVIRSILEEGRLALAAGDTAGAIRAHRRHLRMHAEPEPELIPHRDSVRAELARLQRR